MPKLESKNNVAKAPKPVDSLKATKKKDRPILYPVVTVCGIVIPPEKMRVTVENMKKILGWETEKECLERLTRENLGSSAKDLEALASYGDTYMLIDIEGNKVRCHHNVSNRPFDIGVSKKYAQDLLNKKWSGPDGNGKTVNGETMIVGNYGSALSLQHRGAGLILAEQMRVQPGAPEEWVKNWPGPVVMNSLVVFGVDESEETTMTLDNVRPRTLADILSTSGVFKDLDPAQRKECSRMCDVAIDLFWRRTGAGRKGSSDQYQTHASSLALLHRHDKLQEMVRHLYEENNPGRKVTANLHMSAGQMSALCYLMAASATDEAKYYDSDHPSEKQIDFSHWDRAQEYISLLAQGTDAAIKPVKAALAALCSEGHEGTGSTAEKTAIICRGWFYYAKDGEVKPDSDFTLTYKENEDGERTLDEHPTVGGIDRGIAAGKGDEAMPTQAEVKAATRKAQADKIEAMRVAKSPAKGDAPQEPWSERLARARKQHPAEVLLFKDIHGGLYSLVGADAVTFAERSGYETKLVEDGLSLVTFKASDLDENVRLLTEAGFDVACVERVVLNATGVPTESIKVIGNRVKPKAPAIKPSAPPAQAAKPKPVLKADPTKPKAASDKCKPPMPSANKPKATVPSSKK